MAKTVLIGKAPLTTIRLQSGSRANLPAGAVVPASINKDDAKRLLDEGYLEEIEVVEDEDALEVEVQEPAPPAGDGDFELISGGADAIMADVGTDADLAQAYLDRETGEGGQNRSTLISKLQAVITAGGNA